MTTVVSTKTKRSKKEKAHKAEVSEAPEPAPLKKEDRKEDRKEPKAEETTVLDTEAKVELESLKEKFDRLIEARQAEIRRNKEEILLLKGAYKQYTAELKQSKRRRKVEGPPKMNGFSKPTELHAKLYDFLSVCGVNKGDLVPRTKVTSCLHQYIKDNNLGNTENKKEFNPDVKLKKLLGPPLDRVDLEDESKGFFYSKMGLQKYISQYYPKKDATKK